jgi:hypothetical protein
LSRGYRTTLEGKQIDGAFSFDTDDYVIEAKWTKAGVSRVDADIFASKVKRKGKNVLGLLMSVNGLAKMQLRSTVAVRLL